MKKLNLFTVLAIFLGVILCMPNSVFAQESKTYTIIYKIDDSMGPATGTGDINGEVSVQTTVELTEGQTINVNEVFKEKGFKAFYQGKKFLSWMTLNTDPAKEVETLTTTNFGQVKLGNNTIENAIILTASFDYAGEYESNDYYYISLNPYKGKLDDNGTLKSIVNIRIPKNEFTKVDLTKYVPVGADGYTFTGWYIGESGEGFGYENKTEITKEDFKGNRLQLYVYGAFLANSVESAYNDYVLKLNANGGTIAGESVKEYGYAAPNSGYPIYFDELIPERSGYKFLGWNTLADGTGKNLTGLYWAEWNKDRWNEGDYYELDGKKLTLYATWEKTGEELTTKVEGTEVEVKVELEKKLEEGSSLQIVKVEEEKLAEVKKTEENLKTVFDINVVSNTGDIIKVEDNKMQIRILLEESLRGYDNYQVVYIKDGKIVEKMPTKIDGNYIVFETDHLSEYGIIATNNAAVQNPQTSDNILNNVIIFAIAIAGLALSIVTKNKLAKNN